MYNKRLSKQEKFDAIMQCRNSGLTDYQWCKLNGISHSTFYGWVNQLRRDNCQLPEPADKDTFSPTVKPEVVKLEIVEDLTTHSLVNTTNSTMAVEIEFGQAKIKISNDINPTLLAQIISGLGGCL